MVMINESKVNLVKNGINWPRVANPFKEIPTRFSVFCAAFAFGLLCNKYFTSLLSWSWGSENLTEWVLLASFSSQSSSLAASSVAATAPLDRVDVTSQRNKRPSEANKCNTDKTVLNKKKNQTKTKAEEETKACRIHAERISDL